jgi:hypothetical protein
MGGPWTYADDGRDTDGMHGADREYYESITDGDRVLASPKDCCHATERHERSVLLLEG